MDNAISKKLTEIYCGLYCLMKGKKSAFFVVLFFGAFFIVILQGYTSALKYRKLDTSRIYNQINRMWDTTCPVSYSCEKGSNPAFADLNLTNVAVSVTAARHPDVTRGGRWEPTGCTPRCRVAIVVPYRDREQHLRVFLANIIPYLKEQRVAFTIFVINQAGKTLFNRGALVNVGFLEGLKLYNFKCLIMHDVDMVPMRLCNFYHCGPTGARHLGVSRNRNPPRLWFRGFIGGVLGISRSVFGKINGMTNVMFGWGGEDTEMRGRLKAEHIKIASYSPEIGNYTMVEHERDETNPKSGRESDRNFAHSRYRRLDGFSTLKYHLVSIQKETLYTNITVLLDGPVAGPEAEQRALGYFMSKQHEFENINRHLKYSQPNIH